MCTETYSRVEPSTQALFRKILGDRVLFDEILAPYVAYGVGGPADILTLPENEEELSWIGQTGKHLGVPITIIGRGTNLLIRDEGIRGITVSLSRAFKNIELMETNGANTVSIRCGGGVQKNAALNWAIERGLTGLEFSAGVPGTIGGGIFMNAGTKYGCYGNVLRELRLFDFVYGPRQVITHTEDFTYRNQSLVRDSLVVWALFELHHGDVGTLRERVAGIIAERAAKQPLDHPSCGSTFKNPGGHSAGRLIERAGLKGLRIGGAEISEKHANFILNRGGASARDILNLIEVTKERVRQEFAIDLECEVIVLGG